MFVAMVRSAGLGLLALFLSVVILSLSACGFHLRGYTESGEVKPLPFSTLKVDALGSVDSRLLQMLKQQLTAQGVRLVESEADAQAVLRLTATQFQRIATAKNGQGQVTSELLKMQQAFTLVDEQSGKVLLQGVAMSYRDRNINPQALLAAERELASLKTLMRQEVVQQLMGRLGELGERHPQASAAHQANGQILSRFSPHFLSNFAKIPSPAGV